MGRQDNQDSQKPFHKTVKNNNHASQSSLKVTYTNIDTLTPTKKAELEAELNISKPDIICLTETIPKNYKYEINEDSMSISGYQLHHSDLKQGRGVAIYTACHLRVNSLKTSYPDALCCEVVVGDKKILMGCMYRSP